MVGNIFYLTCGEAIVVLEDVALLMGLLINGKKIIGQTSGLEIDLCEELLGVVPPPEQRKSQIITLIWLQETFGVLPYDPRQQ